MLTKRELYEIISRIPLNNEDRGKLYQYLSQVGGNSDPISPEDLRNFLPEGLSTNNKLVSENQLNAASIEATDEEVRASLNI